METLRKSVSSEVPTTITIDFAQLGDGIPLPVSVELLPTRTYLESRYRVQGRSLRGWCDTLGIRRPGKQGSFSKQDVDLLDDFWIAKNVFNLTEREFVNQVFLPDEIKVPLIAESELENAPALDRFIYQKHNRHIEEILMNLQDFKEHPIIIYKLQRIKELKQQLTANKNQPYSNQ